MNDTFQIYATSGKIKGVSGGLKDKVKMAYSDNRLFTAYIPLNKDTKTLVNFLYTLPQ